MISKIELADKELRDSGLCRQWFEGSDSVVNLVSGSCNGHLFEQLLRAYGYHDWECVNMLRKGDRFCLCSSRMRLAVVSQARP